MCEIANNNINISPPASLVILALSRLHWVFFYMETNKNMFNKGTDYGNGLIRHSLEELGCGRSALCDKNGVIICGNHVYSIAKELGKKIVVIEADKNTLVVVKRTDLEANSKQGKELAFVDNFSQEKNLEWNSDLLQEAMQEDLSFDPRKWGGYSPLVKELSLEDFFTTPNNKEEENSRKTKMSIYEKDTQLSLFDELY